MQCASLRVSRKLGFLQRRIMIKQTVCGLLIAIFAGQLSAAEAKFKAGTDSDGVAASARISTDGSQQVSMPSGFKGTDLIGLEVRDLKDQKLGEISDFVVDVS